jgi:hypothetical protein
MRHVDQSTLDAIINHQLPDRELVRLKEHVRACTLCSRRLEEYRDVFGEVEAIIPTVERDVIHDLEPRSWRRVLMPRLDDGTPRPDRLLWAVVAAAGVATAIVVAMLLRSPALPPVPFTAPPAPASPSAPAVPAPQPAPPEPVTRTAPQPATAPSVPTPRPAPAPASISGIGFRRVESAQAIRSLGGAVRLIDGLLPDHFEMGVGARVPGAVDTLPVVRVIYHDGGNVLLLDEQRRAGVASGDTLIGTAEAGVSVLQWNSAGFWLSLAGRLPVDSLERLARRIR